MPPQKFEILRSRAREEPMQDPIQLRTVIAMDVFLELLSPLTGKPVALLREEFRQNILPRLARELREDAEALLTPEEAAAYRDEFLSDPARLLRFFQEMQTAAAQHPPEPRQHN